MPSFTFKKLNLYWLALVALIGIVLSIGCSGQHPPTQSDYTYQNPNSGQPTTLRPSSYAKARELKEAYKIELSNPKVQVSLSDKSVRFRITKVVNGESEDIELIGQFDHQLQAEMKDTQPVDGKSRIKGFAFCLNSTEQALDCSEMFVNIYFKFQGQVITRQFIADPFLNLFQTAPVAPETEEDITIEPEGSDYEEPAPETDESSPAAGADEADADHSEASGQENTDGQYVAPELPSDFFEDLKAKLQIIPNPIENEPKTQVAALLDPIAPAANLNLTNTFFQTKETLSAALPPFVWDLNLKEGGRAFRGYFTQTNQVTKKLESGRILESSTLIPEVGRCYRRVGREKKSYTTGYTADFLDQVVCDFITENPSCGSAVVGNLSNQTGGILYFNSCKKGKKCAHTSHQNGLEMDLAYLHTDNLVNVVSFKKDQPRVYSSFDRACNYKFAKHYANAKLENGQYVVHAALVHSAVKAALCGYAKQEKLNSPEDIRIFEVLNAEREHHNHTHIRLKCSPGHVGCWQQDDLKDNLRCRL